MIGVLQQSFVPLMILGAVGFGLPRSWLVRRWGQYILVAGLAVVVGRYLCWRLTVTVWPVEGWSIQSAFIWSIFLIELLTWFDTALLFTVLLARTDRRAEADLGEARLRATPPHDLPTVDVLIATYNEPLDVLERTIVGALALDWPGHRLTVHVLDDGQRHWLRQYCERKGVSYLTRDNNHHAKAGNINAAIARTSGEFFLVLDADFVPQKPLLFRAISLFDDPKVGIVQIPHNFFNHDPMQTNLSMQKVLPDDQRLFFDAIMPGRDGWDCAFCCGSNSITRRTAIQAVGNALPTGSITEDMLLTLTLLRKGYVTRYLNERLAIGLAPESLAAFFVQRARWARGGVQMLFLREGPLGPGLKLHQRLLFLPTHWLTQSLGQTLSMATPAIFLWTGLMPLANADTESVLSYQAPAILGAILTIRLLAPGQYFPLASIVHGVLQAFRLLPTVLVTLVKPHGHAFKVTPKGNDASNGAAVDRPTIRLMLGLIVATAVGLFVNASFNHQIIGNGGMVPVVAFWAIVNMIVLLVVATVAITPPRLRAEERFPVHEPCHLVLPSDAGFSALLGTLTDLSMSGGMVFVDGTSPTDISLGRWLVIDIKGVGRIAAVARRIIESPQGLRIGLQFDLPSSQRRDALIEKIFTEGRDNSTYAYDAWAITRQMILRVFRSDAITFPPPRTVVTAPPEIQVLCSVCQGGSATIHRGERSWRRLPRSGSIWPSTCSRSVGRMPRVEW